MRSLDVPIGEAVLTVPLDKTRQLGKLLEKIGATLRAGEGIESLDAGEHGVSVRAAGGAARRGGGAGGAAAGFVVRNDTGTRVEAGEVMGLGDSLAAPATNLAGLLGTPLYAGVATVAADHAEAFAVATARAEPRAWVRCAVPGATAGVLRVRVTGEVERGEEAGLAADGDAVLTGGTKGVRVLWVEGGGSGERWAECVSVGGGVDTVKVSITEVGEGPERGLYGFVEVAWDDPFAPASTNASMLEPVLASPAASYKSVQGGRSGHIGDTVESGTPPLVEINRWPFLNAGQVVEAKLDSGPDGAFLSFAAPQALPSGGEANQTLTLLADGNHGWAWVSAPHVDSVPESMT